MAKKARLDYYCKPMLLPDDLQYDAAVAAARSYPPNAPLWEYDPRRIAVLTSKWWGPGPHRFTVSFVEQQSQAFINKVIASFNTWRTRARCAVEFVWTQRDGQLRVATGLRDGYYSYLGRDNEHIPLNQHTMSLSDFTVRTPDSEWLRVPPHECGHFLGCPHEQQRHGVLDDLDPEKTIALFMRTQGWTRQMVINQVLVPIEERSLTGASPVDPTSIMCYSFPASITKSGRPIPGGSDLTALDIQFMSRIYPLTEEPPPPTPPPTGGAWKYALAIDKTTGAALIAPAP